MDIPPFEYERKDEISLRQRQESSGNISYLNRNYPKAKTE